MFILISLYLLVRHVLKVFPDLFLLINTISAQVSVIILIIFIYNHFCKSLYNLPFGLHFVFIFGVELPHGSRLFILPMEIVKIAGLVAAEIAL